MPFKDRWELTSLFSQNEARNELVNLRTALEKTMNEHYDTKKLIEQLEKLDTIFKELEAYINCLLSENTQNREATELYANLMDTEPLLSNLFTSLENQLKGEPLFDELVQDPSLAPLRFFLEEKKGLASRKLSPDQEAIISALSADGYSALSTLYDQLKNKITVPAYETEKPLSYPEAENCLNDINRNVRRHTHHALTRAFEKEEELFGELLNHISGFRLKVYEQRGWDDFLDEARHLNRLSKDSLDTMFSSIQTMGPAVERFSQAKSSLLNINQLSWYDIEAPITDLEPHYAFKKGAQMVLDAFEPYGARLTEFARKALTSNWIDAESRSTKRAGGFCTSFPRSKETRIFMNYKGSFDNVLVLAHELGHAFHAEVTFDQPLFNQDYPMNLAETASTMCEQILLDHYLEAAKNDSERLILLDKKISRNIIYLTNLPARYYFECKLHEERKNGFVGPEKLSQMMVEAQKKAFFNILDEYFPPFWASKLHFYITDYAPFYNFPYTFGFLFSFGTYLILMEDRKNFEANYIALLEDTGRMSTEELAKKHLGVDLTKPLFYERVLKSVSDEIEEYAKLSIS